MIAFAVDGSDPDERIPYAEIRGILLRNLLRSGDALNEPAPGGVRIHQAFDLSTDPLGRHFMYRDAGDWKETEAVTDGRHWLTRVDLERAFDDRSRPAGRSWELKGGESVALHARMHGYALESADRRCLLSPFGFSIQGVGNTGISGMARWGPLELREEPQGVASARSFTFAEYVPVSRPSSGSESSRYTRARAGTDRRSSRRVDERRNRPQNGHLTPARADPTVPIPSRWDWYGAVAQLGERCVRNAEVGGSIPLGSTSTGSVLSEPFRVEIEYCTRCRWLPRAAWVAQELLATFDVALAGVTLVPNREGGVFEVRLGGECLFSRSEAGRFPEAAELKRLVRDRVAPERSLGHVDRAAEKEAR